MQMTWIRRMANAMGKAVRTWGTWQMIRTDDNTTIQLSSCIGEKRQRKAAKGTSGESISGLITEKAKTSGGKAQKESGILLRTLHKLSYKFLINSKNSQYICWKLQ